MSLPNPSRKKALIVGVSGQDGAFLAKFLIKKDYEVYGTSRNLSPENFTGLQYLKVDDVVINLQMIPTDFEDVFRVIASVMPDEIYNLSGQSSVGLSFFKPVEAFNSIALGTLYILESIRLLEGNIKLYNAGSGEVFGDTGGRPADELTVFKPASPYGVAKATSTWQVTSYRDSYGLHASTGILFNHESVLRPEAYVTKKIVLSAARIANGSKETLSLGNINISRDWGYAPEYVEAMWLMLQRETPDDFIIATGTSVSLQYFVEQVFLGFGLDWNAHVEIDRSLFRPSEIQYGGADPSKASNELGWNAKTSVEGLVRYLTDPAYDKS